MSEVVYVFDRFGLDPLPWLLAGIVVAGFSALDWLLSREARARLSALLRGTGRARGGPGVTVILAGAFDRVFGRRHLSLRCFAVSALCSLLFLTLLTLADIADEDPATFVYVDGMLPYFATAVLALAILPDYLSLLQTRWALRRIGAAGSGVGVAFWLVLDLALTIAIFVIVAPFLYSAGLYGAAKAGLTAPVSFDYLGFQRAIVGDFIAIGWRLGGPPPSTGVYFYSTMLTSIWLWLSGLGFLVMRFLVALKPVFAFLAWALPVDTHPMRAMGTVAGALVLAFGVSGALIL